ncbi:MAG TPA: hypothetical protein VGO58_13530 [Chitinophagaceae bacterium]|jgi:hypothetical protein|nr:hypothetical protein [Chitinophagaceae bacterium]
MKFTILSVFILLLVRPVLSQSVGIGTATPHTSAVLDVQSTNKGLAIPSMTTTQRTGIGSPKPGLLVFDIDKNTIYMHDGTQWLALLFTASSSQLPPIVRVPSDTEIGDQFGFSVSINSSYAVIGAPFDNVGGNTNQGCAYIFYRNGSAWTEQAKLVAPNGSANDNFGRSVSISGNYVIVGALNDQTSVPTGGSAYIFLRSGVTWSEQAKLVPSNPANGDQFGSSVAIDGTYAVVGALSDDVGANVNEGSAYFFHRIGTSWVQEDQVVAPFGAAQDRFGTSVSISGDIAVIGAPLDDVGATADQGSAHVYLRSGTNWDYHAALADPFPADGNHFGESVDIDGNYIVVGVPYSSSYAGSRAHIFLRNGPTWDMQFTLHANPVINSAPVNLFGISVSIDGDYVIIGSSEALVGEGIDQGASYVFKRDGVEWIFVKRIYDPAGEPNEHMGNGVGVSGQNTITGAPDANVHRGRIFFFNLE